jgi:CDP-2,3-bis-(O-geranylgeranyl)-sn-glycerol synthase
VGKDILLAIWFFLPAGAANAAPILVRKIPPLSGLTHPIDHGLVFRGKQLLGPHKTWRWLIAGIVVGTTVLWLQQLVYSFWFSSTTVINGINYHTLPTLVLGPLFGIGALGGDAVESFFKRQRGTPSGHTWFPFDQIDYILGSIVATLLIVRLRPLVYVYAVLIWSFMSLVSSYIGHKLKLKERPV